MSVDIRIVGLGAFYPERLVKNEQLPALDPPLPVEEIDRIGVLSRHWAGDADDSVKLAVSAARKAMERAEASPDSIDFVIFANWSERRYVPDLAPRLQEALGIQGAFAFDVCGACTGFLLGVTAAAGYMQSARFRRGLVVAGDCSSRRMRPGSRATIVFGDAAGAAVLERDGGRGRRVVDFELRSEGARHGIMEIDADGYLKAHIRQRDLNELAVSSLARASGALLERNRVTWNDVDWVVPHSGTPGIQALLAERLGIDASKVLQNLPRIGNVTTASIPCALDEYIEAGVIRPEHSVLVAAVGLGWNTAAALLVP